MAVSRLKAVAGVIILSLATLVVAIGILAHPVKLKQSEAEPTSESASTPTKSPANTPNPSPTPIPATPISAETDKIVATVNGEVISETDWEQALKLDAALNSLAGQPPPDPEKALDRLINEILILEAKPAENIFSRVDVETRLQDLMAAWQASESDLSRTLNEVGLTREGLADRILRLLNVEYALQQLTAEGVDLEEWLAQARSQAEIGLYQPLVAANLNAQESGAEPAAVQVTPPPPEPPADLSTQPYAGAVAPDFTLTTLTDEPVTLSQLRGKPTLINFWASWCPPCRQELPALQSTYDAYGETINFLAVNVKESRGTVQSFAEKMNLTFPILLDGQGQVSDHLYQVRGIPTTLFVDARGVVVNRHVGPLDETTINAYLQPLLLPQTVANGEESRPAVETPSAEPKEQTGPPRTGDQAPDFSLPDNRGNEFKLAEELKVNAVVLVFYRGHT